MPPRIASVGSGMIQVGSGLQQPRDGKRPQLAGSWPSRLADYASFAIIMGRLPTPDIMHLLTIDAAPERVFDALTTTDGIKELVGRSQTGGRSGAAGGAKVPPFRYCFEIPLGWP